MSASVPEPPPDGGEEVVHRQLLGFIYGNPSFSIETAAVAGDLVKERVEFGREKYGTELMTHNGRDPVEDARQELGDLAMYIAQAKMEGRDTSELKRILEVVRELL